jgi:1-deoxy-D-xylulose-5-phosphate reductoisomerase
MEISISSVLFENNDIDLDKFSLNLPRLKSLNFYEVNNEKFKAIDLAKFSLKVGGLAPAVLNYANELMVTLFLKKKILFTDIVIKNEKLLNQFIHDGNNKLNPNIKDINNSFKIIDEYAYQDSVRN